MKIRLSLLIPSLFFLGTHAASAQNWGAFQKDFCRG
jgi:hypothetical protein